MKLAKQCFEALVLFLISQTATLGTNDTGNKELSFILNHTVSRALTCRSFFEIERRSCINMTRFQFMINSQPMQIMQQFLTRHTYILFIFLYSFFLVFSPSTDPKYPVLLQHVTEERCLTQTPLAMTLTTVSSFIGHLLKLLKKAMPYYKSRLCVAENNSVMVLLLTQMIRQSNKNFTKHSLPSVTTRQHVFRHLPGTWLNRVSQGEIRTRNRMNFTLILILQVSDSTN